jgi:hypothetical protein
LPAVHEESSAPGKRIHPFVLVVPASGASRNGTSVAGMGENGYRARSTMNTAATVVAAVALAIGTGYVVAQTAPPAAAPPTKDAPPMTPPNDMPTSPQANTPPSMRPGTPTAPMAPDFATLDHKGVGYVTLKDATGNDWLARNFETCDADRNGQVSRAEYAACSTRP